MGSTSGAALTVSPASIASYSGQDTTLTAQGDLHATAAHTASLVSCEATSLHTHEGELQATQRDQRREFSTPGAFTVKGASHTWAGGSKGSAILSSLPANLLHSDGPFIGLYELHKNDACPFEAYRYRIVDDDRILFEGKTSATGQTGMMSTARAKFVEVQKTIMRDDQKITENWAGYLSGTVCRLALAIPIQVPRRIRNRLPGDMVETTDV